MVRILFSTCLIGLLSGCMSLPLLPGLSSEPRVSPQVSPPVASAAKPAPKIALVLGGGGTRGFAHVGVIKALEAQGIFPDIVVGTSAGSVVGALYSKGFTGIELQEITIQMEMQHVIDLNWLDYKLTSLIFNPIEGEALQNFINQKIKNLPIEKLQRKFAAVATDLHSGEMIVFQNGNAGQAVRASSAVPGVFRPVYISGRYYVDGGLVRPVPVSVARSLGADFVIAVDISSNPKDSTTESRLKELLQTFNIMIKSINQYELAGADVVIRPETSKLDQGDFNGRHQAVLEGEKAALVKMAELKAKLKPN